MGFFPGLDIDELVTGFACRHTMTAARMLRSGRAVGLTRRSSLRSHGLPRVDHDAVELSCGVGGLAARREQTGDKTPCRQETTT